MGKRPAQEVRSVECIESLGLVVEASAFATAQDALSGNATPATQTPNRIGILVANHDATLLLGKIQAASDTTAPTIDSTHHDLTFETDKPVILKIGDQLRLWLKYSDGVAGAANTKELL